MKTVLSKSDDLFTGKYLFHFHTQLTDGTLEVRDYFSFARDQGYDRLIFLEHIRATPSYNVDALVDEIRGESIKSGIRALIGFETKLLPGGRLDINDHAAGLADVLGLAEHGFLGDLELLEDSLTRAFQNYREYVERQKLVWVHPGLWFKKNGALRTGYDRYLFLLRQAQDAGLWLERNMRYELLPRSLIGQVDSARISVGADVHTSADLARCSSWIPTAMDLIGP